MHALAACIVWLDTPSAAVIVMLALDRLPAAGRRVQLYRIHPHRRYRGRRSMTTSSGALSSRSPRKRGCRRNLSQVHSVKPICAT